MPVHVYITVFGHDWVIIHKQRFPAVLVSTIMLANLHSSTLLHKIAWEKNGDLPSFTKPHLSLVIVM